jgi:ribonuclease HII
LAAGAAREYRCSGRQERLLRAQGFRSICGVDEVGRGALFGPVFAAAVILAEDKPVRGLADSKTLLPERREVLAGRIRERAVAWAVGAAGPFEIDRWNIYQATRLAMRRAVACLRPSPDYLILDAMRIDLPIPQLPMVKADAQCQAVAAASILAKVHRDDCMSQWDTVFPQYGLARNKGYGTPEHYRALDEHGPTELHRFSFWPVRHASRLRFGGNFAEEQMALFEDPE